MTKEIPKLIGITLFIVAAIAGSYFLLNSTHGTIEIGTQLGARALEIDVEGINQTRFMLSQQKGKIVVVEFMTTWCGYCESQIDVLKQLKVEIGTIVIASIDIDVNLSPTELNDWAAKKSMGWFVGHSPEAGLDYEVSGVPTVIVVDKEGIIRYRGFYTDLSGLNSVIRQIG